MCLCVCVPCAVVFSWPRTWGMLALMRSWKRVWQQKMWLNQIRPVTCKAEFFFGNLSRVTHILKCFKLLFYSLMAQAGEEGLHHGQIHRETLRSEEVSRWSVETAHAVWCREGQRYFLSYSSLCWGGGSNGAYPAGQWTCKSVWPLIGWWSYRPYKTCMKILCSCTYNCFILINNTAINISKNSRFLKLFTQDRILWLTVKCICLFHNLLLL